jgi:hypothetical protein
VEVPGLQNGLLNVILVELDYQKNCAVSEIKTNSNYNKLSVSRFPINFTNGIKKAVNFEGLGKTSCSRGPVPLFANEIINKNKIIPV